jgi:CelD/BcsL family acetyltransferase involved in cellulose biosynthesis
VVDRLEQLRDDWTRLAGQSDNVFATFEFAATWWEHFGGRRRLLIVACREENGDVFAILPLYRWKRRPLTIVRFLGHGAGDVLGPICAPADRADAARALRRVLHAPLWHWDVFVGENLPAQEAWSAQLGGIVLRREGNPVLRASGDFDDFLATRTRNFRHQVRLQERRLARRHDVRYRRTTGADQLDVDLDSLFRLHTASWGKASAFAGPRTAFHRAFAHQAFEHGWLRLWILDLDGHPVAALYGFRFGNTQSLYQSGRAPEFRRESVGAVLTAHTVREALSDGIRECRFLRGHETYKYRFANEDSGLESVCMTRTATGAMALAVMRALRSSAATRRALRRPLDV